MISEPQEPTEFHEQVPPSKEELTGQAETMEPMESASPESQPAPAPVKKAKIPDWRPLGAVRDYFNEQIKQDQRW